MHLRSVLSKNRPLRVVLGLGVAAYAPIFAVLLIAATPRFLVAPKAYFWLAPALMAAMGLALVLWPRAIRISTILLGIVLSVWLIENVSTSVYYLTRPIENAPGWQPMSFVAAVKWVAKDFGYWLFVLVPLALSLLILAIFRSDSASNQPLNPTLESEAALRGRFREGAG